VAVWLSYGLATMYAALEAFGLLRGVLPPETSAVVVHWVHDVTALSFPVLIFLGARATTDNRLPTQWWWGVLLPGLVGGLFAWGGFPAVVDTGKEFLTPIALLVSCVYILLRVSGPRAPGLLRVGLVLGGYGVLSSGYLALRFVPAQPTPGEPLYLVLILIGFGDAVALALLGLSVLMLFIEDAHLAILEQEHERLEAMAAAADRLAQVISGAEDAILTVNTEGHIATANPAGERMFGVSGETLVGRPLLSILPHPVLGRAGNGETFPVEATISPLGEGGREGTVVIARDIRRQVKLEEEQLRLEGDLRETHSMLTLGRSAARMVAAVRSLLGQVEGGLPEGRRQHIATALDSLEAFAAMDPSRPRRAFPLATAIRDAVHQIGARQDLREVQIDIARVEEALWVEGDPAGLTLALVCVLDNAVAAAGPDGVVRLRTRAVGGTVSCVVEDSGAGIAHEALPYVFDPFYAGTEREDGLGLGLAVVRQVMTQQGGGVELENRPGLGIGVRCILTLPQATRETKATGPDGVTRPRASAVRATR
jgi:anti-sigma regulatory factor (Ser/Thr protein kinase)